jgi:soluble lytic murein transglycosylase-like protein
MPETAQGMGIDPWNPRQALEASARLDAGHLKQFAQQAQALAKHYGGIVARYAYGLALAAYNAGPGATKGAWNRAYANGTRWPDSGPWAWLKWLAGETQRYVSAILGCSL